MIVRCRRCGDVALSQTVDVAALEESSCPAKNEVDVPSDITVFKVLAPTIQKDSVLPTQKPAVAKNNAIAVNANCERLAHRAGRVFESNVLGREIVGVDD